MAYCRKSLNLLPLSEVDSIHAYWIGRPQLFSLCVRPSWLGCVVVGWVSWYTCTRD